MDDLVRWLGEQLDTDERIAQAATPGPWHAQDGGVVSDDDEQWPVGASESAHEREDRVHIAAHDPARVLREIDAKRDLLRFAQGIHDHHETFTTGVAARLEGTLRRFALAYEGRTGFKESWRP